MLLCIIHQGIEKEKNLVHPYAEFLKHFFYENSTYFFILASNKLRRLRYAIKEFLVNE